MSLSMFRLNRKKRSGKRSKAPKGASAETIATMCAEASVPMLAHGLINARASESQAKARIAEAVAVRDACSESGYQHLADEAIAAVGTQRYVSFLRTLLTEVTADASSNEIDHHPPV